MIERIVDDPDFVPYALWQVVIAAVCPKCRKKMKLKEEEGSETLECPSCGYSCGLGKSPDDVADDVLEHVKGNRKMNVKKIREQAEIETEVEKKEAKEGSRRSRCCSTPILSELRKFWSMF